MTPDFFNQLSLLEITPQKATEGVRRILADGEQSSQDELLDALRAACWKLITGRVFGEGATGWYGLFRQVGGFFLSQNRSDHAARVNVLADLLLESVRFGHTNPLVEVVARQHVKDILRAISVVDKNGQGARRVDILEYTGLKQSNLSRIFFAMESHGLINRATKGKEVVVSMTASGREALNDRGDQNPDDSYFEMQPRPDWLVAINGDG